MESFNDLPTMNRMHISHGTHVKKVVVIACGGYKRRHLSRCITLTPSEAMVTSLNIKTFHNHMH